MVTQANNGVGEQLKLRKATAEDFESIREIARSSRMIANSHFMTQEEVDEEVQIYYNDDVLNGIINNPANAIYVVERGNHLLGHCSVLPKDRRGRPRLLQFYVRPEGQGQGVGTMLFQKAVAHLKEAGCTDMYVSTLGDNSVGRTFLERHGCRLMQVYDSMWDGKTHTVAFYYLPL